MESYLNMSILIVVVFFFSSRRRHTRLQGDWSSDVCSSDLAPPQCSAPGVTVATDAAGDQTGGAANTQMDILKIQLSESYASGSGMLSVTMTDRKSVV